MENTKLSRFSCGIFLTSRIVTATADQLFLELLELLQDICPLIAPHMGPEAHVYSSKSTNGGKGLQNSKINSYFTP